MWIGANTCGGQRQIATALEWHTFCPTASPPPAESSVLSAGFCRSRLLATLGGWSEVCWDRSGRWPACSRVGGHQATEQREKRDYIIIICTRQTRIFAERKSTTSTTVLFKFTGSMRIPAAPVRNAHECKRLLLAHAQDESFIRFVLYGLRQCWMVETKRRMQVWNVFHVGNKISPRLSTSTPECFMFNRFRGGLNSSFGGF